MLRSWLSSQHSSAGGVGMGKKQLQLKKGGKRDLKQGGWAGLQEQQHCSRRGNCCRCLGQRQRRNYSRTKGGKDAAPRHLRHRSLGGQMGVQRSGSQYIISWKIRNPCLLERMISSPNLATGGRVITAWSSVDPDPQKSTSRHTAQT